MLPALGVGSSPIKSMTGLPSPIDRYFLQAKAGRAVKGRLVAIEKELPKIIEEYCKKKGDVLIGNC